MIECYAAIFARFLNSFAPPARTLLAYYLERGGMMRLEQAVQMTSDIKAQVPRHGFRGEC